MKKSNTRNIVFFVMMLMSLHVLITSSYTTFNRVLATFGIVILIIAFTKSKNSTKV